MNTILLRAALAVIFAGFVGIANAEPVQLTSPQMDNVTAGGNLHPAPAPFHKPGPKFDPRNGHHKHHKPDPKPAPKKHGHKKHHPRFDPHGPKKPDPKKCDKKPAPRPASHH